MLNRQTMWRRAVALAGCGGLVMASLAAARVNSEHLARKESRPNAPYANVPPPSSTDAATNATFTVLDGVVMNVSAGVNVLHDGRTATTEDEPSSNFFFQWDTLEGRVRVDLGKPIPIAQVNTYSWHKEARGPQVYKLYASDGSAANFNPAPKNGTDPTTCGWTKVATVDTRPRGADGRPIKKEQMGGRYAVSIDDPSGSIGTYRYLLFAMFTTETEDAWGHTFYSEIDVVEKK